MKKYYLINSKENKFNFIIVLVTQKEIYFDVLNEDL
jgi:hypothetical protein